MAYKLIKQMIPTSKYSIKATHPMKPRFLVIHNTSNKASARNEIAYMTRNNAYTSYHVAVDDKEVIQAIPYNRNAWHAGDGANGKGNRYGVGIEICYSTHPDRKLYDQAEANAIEFSARLLIELGLGARDVYFHQDMNNKYCPHKILSEGRGQAFKDAIAKRYYELKNDKKPSKPAPKPEKKDNDLFRVFDANNKKVGAYDNSKNAHAHAKKIKGIVRHYEDGKLSSSKDYGKSSASSSSKPDVRVVTAHMLNVREEPNAKAKIVETVRKDEAFTVVEELSNGWVKLKSGGYVYGRYLKKT